MPLINQHHIIDGIDTATVSIHEQKISHIQFADFPQANELLVDYRPLEFSEKHPPKPQLVAAELVALSQQKGDKKLGILLSGASDYQILAQDLVSVLPVIDVIVIDFNGFRDGRGYSLGREIAQHPQYRADIILRASGDIIPDSLQLLAEVGFSQFDIPDADFNESWFGYFDSVEHRYTGRSTKQLPMFAQ